MAANIPHNREMSYYPPDVYNPFINPPPGEIDVLSIIESGTEFQSTLNPDHTKEFYKKPIFSKSLTVDEYGKGIRADASFDDYCDGSYDSWCKRNKGNNCQLYAHNDARQGYLFDSYSGWIVMNIPDLKNGYIVVKLETWHHENEVGRTQTWRSINNNNKRRELKKQPQKRCSEFLFDYSIDGTLTSVNTTEFGALQSKGRVQRVVETFVLLADPNYTGGDEKEVQVAIRIRNCAQGATFKLSHIYWS